MDCPKLRTRHEQYIYTILIKPYCQYLYRICELHQLSCYENDHAELSLPQLNSPQRKGFILYNLLHFMGR